MGIFRYTYIDCTESFRLTLVMLRDRKLAFEKRPNAPKPKISKPYKGSMVAKRFHNR